MNWPYFKYFSILLDNHLSICPNIWSLKEYRFIASWLKTFIELFSWTSLKNITTILLDNHITQIILSWTLFSLKLLLQAREKFKQQKLICWICVLQTSGNLTTMIGRRFIPYSCIHKFPNRNNYKSRTETMLEKINLKTGCAWVHG